jgi:hypothetical protein
MGETMPKQFTNIYINKETANLIENLDNKARNGKCYTVKPPDKPATGRKPGRRWIDTFYR